MRHFLLVFTTVLATAGTASIPISQTRASQSPETRAFRAPGVTIDAYLKGLAAQNQFSGAVLVARKGRVLLARGYGMAVRERRVPNSPTTKYPVGGVSFALSLVAGLKLEEQGKLKDGASVCSYLSSCPDTWKSMTVGMVLDGTSGLGDANWGLAGRTTAQSLAGCQQEALVAAPGTRVDYQTCTVVVLGNIFEKVTGKHWAAFMRRAIFRPAGMTRSGRMTDSFLPPAHAQDYSGINPDRDTVYNDYYAVYSTLQDVYAYDNALFAGKILSKSSLRRLFAPRATVSPADVGISNERQAAKWKVGNVASHSVIFTLDGTKSFATTNMRFPMDGATVIVVSNDAHNDVQGVTIHVAALLFEK